MTQGYQYGMLNPKPRVLIVDNDPRTRFVYQDLIFPWGFEPVLALGERDSLIRDAKEKAEQMCCCLAIIDIDLINDYDEEDTSGLKLAKELKPVHSIVLFGQSNQKVLNEIIGRSDNITFVKKTDSPENIRPILEEEARKVCAIKRGLHITPPDIFENIFQTELSDLVGVYPDQIADVLAQLFPNAHSLKIEKLETKSVSSSISSVPRPKSVILMAYEDDYEPVIVKMARASKISIEVERYYEHIAKRLTGNFFAHMERHAVLWGVGGASYSYVGDFDVKTFSHYYEEQPIENIEECLKFFFMNTWSRHYGRAQEVENASLFELYGKVWGDWYEKRVQNFVLPIMRPISVYVSLKRLDPIEWLKQNVAENPARDASRVARTKVAVTHGDLHAENLLIDSKKNAWVIDFERTGVGHILQDFVELESDLLNRLPYSGESYDDLFDLWLNVTQPNELGPIPLSDKTPGDPEIRKVIQTASILRTLARECTGITDFRQYLWGLLFNTIFRATIISKDEPHKRSQTRALLLASAICRRLEQMPVE